MNQPLNIDEFRIIAAQVEADILTAVEGKYDPAVALAVIGKIYATMLAVVVVEQAQVLRTDAYTLIEVTTDSLKSMAHRFSRKVVNESNNPQEIVIIHPAGNA